MPSNEIQDGLTLIRNQMVAEGLDAGVATDTVKMFAANMDEAAARDFITNYWAARAEPVKAIDPAVPVDEELVIDWSSPEVREIVASTDIEPLPGEITDEELAEFLETLKTHDFALSVATYYRERGYLTPKQRAAAISIKEKYETKKRSGGTHTYVTEAGIYKHEDLWYRVRWNRTRTHLYAQRIVAHAGSVRFHNAPGLMKALDPSHRVTASEAAEFGKAYGACMFCGLTLSTEESINVGYGPTCAKHNHLPWGIYLNERVER